MTQNRESFKFWSYAKGTVSFSLSSAHTRDRSFFNSHEVTKDVIVCAVFEHRNTELNRTASSDKLVNVKQPAGYRGRRAVTCNAC